MRIKAETLAGMLSDDCRRLNGMKTGGVADGDAAGRGWPEVAPPTCCPKPPPRPATKGNRTEMRALELARRRFPRGMVFAQPSRFFPLKGGGTYTPDFLVFCEGMPVVVIEVKGGYRGPGADQGIERYRRAAAQWDGGVFSFQMWTWDQKGKEWEISVWSD